MSQSLVKTFDTFTSSLRKMDKGMNAFFENKKFERYVWILLISGVFSLVLLLNILTPLIADDYAYQLIFATKDYIGGIGDVFTSQVNHYNEWGGRSVVHFIAQVLLMLPPLATDVLNTLVYLLFISLVYLHIKGRGKRSLSLFILIGLAVWLFMPMLGDTVFWVTGSANYLWGTTIILLFLIPYRLYAGEKGCVKKQLLTFPFFFLGGIITGWTNENTVAGLVFILILLFLFYRSQRWEIRINHFAGLIGVLIGYAVMIMAPGNFKRGGESLEFGFSTILYRIFSYTQTLFVDYGYLLLIFFLLLLLIYRMPQDRERELSSMHLAYIYLLGAIVSIYVMILSPQFPARAWFGLVTYVIIAVGILFYQLDWKNPLVKSIRNICVSVGVLVFIFSYLSASKDIYRMYNIDKARVIQVEEAKKRGDKQCFFDMNRPQTKYLHAEDINGNHLLVHHYGIHIEYK